MPNPNSIEKCNPNDSIISLKRFAKKHSLLLKTINFKVNKTRTKADIAREMNRLIEEHNVNDELKWERNVMIAFSDRLVAAEKNIADLAMQFESRTEEIVQRSLRRRSRNVFRDQPEIFISLLLIFVMAIALANIWTTKDDVSESAQRLMEQNADPPVID